VARGGHARARAPRALRVSVSSTSAPAPAAIAAAIHRFAFAVKIEREMALGYVHGMCARVYVCVCVGVYARVSMTRQPGISGTEIGAPYVVRLIERVSIDRTCARVDITQLLPISLYLSVRDNLSVECIIIYAIYLIAYSCRELRALVEEEDVIIMVAWIASADEYRFVNYCVCVCVCVYARVHVPATERRTGDVARSFVSGSETIARLLYLVVPSGFDFSQIGIVSC